MVILVYAKHLQFQAAAMDQIWGMVVHLFGPSHIVEEARQFQPILLLPSSESRLFLLYHGKPGTYRSYIGMGFTLLIKLQEYTKFEVQYLSSLFPAIVWAINADYKDTYWRIGLNIDMWTMKI